jgi:hypothetical protein
MALPIFAWFKTRESGLSLSGNFLIVNRSSRRIAGRKSRATGKAVHGGRFLHPLP